jgi:uncharacterized MAPEG superfamily protein
MYLITIPFTSWLTTPNSVVEKLVDAVVRLIPGGSVPSDRVLPALAAVYTFWTFGASGSISAAGQAMAREEGLDNNTPRRHVHLLSGLPLRLRSAHYALVENFPGFALAAALTQTLAPNNVQIVNLLGLHVICRLFLHYPLYLMDIATPRSLSHLVATSALINVCWRLALGEK